MEEKEHHLSRYVKSRMELVLEARNIEPNELEQVYLPASLAHVYFPRRDPKLSNDQPYIHENGHYTLYLSQRPLLNKFTKKFEYFGLPFGPKARIILSVINAMALQQGSPKLDLDANSLSTFLTRIGFTDGGNQLAQARNQVARLARADINIQYSNGRINSDTGQEGTTETSIRLVSEFDFWAKEKEGQPTLWDRNIVLSNEYWETLQKHALPLSLEHLKILSGNARAIDIYTFFAYRLHVINKPVFLAWTILKEMFGGEISAMNEFKRTLRQTLNLVKLAYPNAKFELDNKGMTLHNSPPPIKGKSKIELP